ncbi:MarR family transcriptional regulator [Streptomyces sp. NPDC049954]|uniref:MarR family winged helix-turn-helix transcriptional regulator n=1 Tax=Streptomyces sp. NPDC049954 TaxID=3155779 RepID=UPI00342722CA
MDHEEPQAPPEAALHGALLDLAYAMSGSRVHTRLRTEAEVPVDRAGLALLRILTAADGPLRMGELANALMVRASHVSREVRNLQRRGLVDLLPEAGDLRVRRITATPRGRELVSRAEAASQGWLNDALGDFSAEELRITAAVIRRIVDTYRRE